MTQPLQICIGPTVRIGRESWCLPYAGFIKQKLFNQTKNGLLKYIIFVLKLVENCQYWGYKEIN